MFAQFIVPYDFNSNIGAYTWVVHKAAQSLGSDLRLIASWDYWAKSSEIIDIAQNTAPNGDYEYLISRNLTSIAFSSLDFVNLDKHYFHSKYSSLPQSKVLSILQDGVDEELQANIYHGLVANTALEGLLLWTNCCSAVQAARQASVPTIFNEIGPLRPPIYHPAAYFDFRGLHDQAQAEDRWGSFWKDPRTASLPVLERSALLALLRQVPLTKQVDRPTGLIGVALQYPGGVHLKYSSNFTNACTIDFVQRHFNGPLLIRAHPGARNQSSMHSLTNDESNTPEEFLRKCDVVVTINSGIAFEAILMGKETYVLGHSPIAMGAWDIVQRAPKMDISTETLWLNWFAFAYLLPFHLLFNAEYYRWRLSNPSERDVYMHNYSWWIKHGGVKDN